MPSNDNQPRQRYYPLRKPENPHRVDLIPISEEQYNVLYREIHRIRKREQRAGRCHCPKRFLWKCDASCDDCEFYRSNTLSFDDEMNGIKLMECLISPDDGIQQYECEAFKEALWLATTNLDERDRHIVYLFANGLTERDIAVRIGCSQKTVNNRKRTIFKVLEKYLSDWR